MRCVDVELGKAPVGPKSDHVAQMEAQGHDSESFKPDNSHSTLRSRRPFSTEAALQTASLTPAG